GGRGGPRDGRRLREESREWLGAEAVPGLRDGGPAHRAASRAGRQDEVEMAHDFADRAVAQQRHPDDEPHDVLRGQLAPADRRGARRLQSLRDPRRIQRLAEELEAWGAVARAHRQDGLPQLHHPASVGETNYTLWIKGSRI